LPVQLDHSRKMPDALDAKYCVGPRLGVGGEPDDELLEPVLEVAARLVRVKQNA
jgi:hypothetical protein